MNGKLIVIEGLDGSGKATQAKLLAQTLAENGERVKKITFPDYESESSALVRMYLHGEFGSRPGDVNAYAASAFYAVDRFASFKKDWGEVYQSGGLIIADRYATSNGIHQCSKLDESLWDEYLAWLEDFEYKKLGIPAPDTVIYLKADTDISQKLMSGRYGGDESKKDIHEGDIEYLKRSQKAAAYCAQKLGWKTVECVQDGKMRTIEDIHNEIMTLI
ncbi:MAG: deoxynucleoside kinase [Ruminococcus sp.]|nr:deoxynucleoside kinase [Ruminococcus sp.]